MTTVCTKTTAFLLANSQKKLPSKMFCFISIIHQSKCICAATRQFACKSNAKIRCHRTGVNLCKWRRRFSETQNLRNFPIKSIRVINSFTVFISSPFFGWYFAIIDKIEIKTSKFDCCFTRTHTPESLQHFNFIKLRFLSYQMNVLNECVHFFF